MSGFLLTAALLLAAALLFVLPPLWQRPRGGHPAADTGAAALALRVLREQRDALDAARTRGELTEADHAAERAALERRVLAEAAPTAPAPGGTGAPARGLALALALGLPLAAAAIYTALGRPDSLRAAAPQAAGASAPHTLDEAQVAAMVERLAERLQREGGSSEADGEAWHMLARSRLAQGRLPEAVAAYERAVALRPRDAPLLADAADALALANGRQLAGRPQALAEAALAIDPRQPKALGLAGTAAFQRGDAATAVRHWQQLLALQPAGSEAAQRTAASLAQAQAARASPAAVSAAAAEASADTSALRGEVHLAPALQARLQGGETLFILARPPQGSGTQQGSRLPVAVIRQPLATWPVAFQLGDAQAMPGGPRLSQQAAVVLAARISRSGQALPQSGDLMGTLGPVAPGASGLRLVIDGVVP